MNVAGRPAREADKGEFDIVIVGAGFAGLYSLYKLRGLGYSVRVYEAGTGVGGTWYWNRYPGAACDIESYIYLPMLEELGYIPTEKYAQAPEIFAHCQRIAKHYGLYERALFQTGADKAVWDEGRRRWIVHTDRGDRIAARFLIPFPTTRR